MMYLRRIKIHKAYIADTNTPHVGGRVSSKAQGEEHGGELLEGLVSHSQDEVHQGTTQEAHKLHTFAGELGEEPWCHNQRWDP